MWKSTAMKQAFEKCCCAVIACVEDENREGCDDLAEQLRKVREQRAW